jgi:hypothetical protein
MAVVASDADSLMTSAELVLKVPRTVEPSRVGLVSVWGTHEDVLAAGARAKVLRSIPGSLFPGDRRLVRKEMSFSISAERSRLVASSCLSNATAFK